LQDRRSRLALAPILRPPLSSLFPPRVAIHNAEQDGVVHDRVALEQLAVQPELQQQQLALGRAELHRPAQVEVLARHCPRAHGGRQRN
jgi:hypothetical protein